jgi:hypothetical protein
VEVQDEKATAAKTQIADRQKKEKNVKMVNGVHGVKLAQCVRRAWSDEPPGR